ncbi:FYVE, RhoGEF and PH domain-containing protein 3 [Lamellibrachia satsuma]|nr:FYVE, RhoGEF and PH domain-containing protein 3 [Lamellibrachia satsuma]
MGGIVEVQAGMGGIVEVQAGMGGIVEVQAGMGGIVEVQTGMGGIVETDRISLGDDDEITDDGGESSDWDDDSFDSFSGSDEEPDQRGDRCELADDDGRNDDDGESSDWVSDSSFDSTDDELDQRSLSGDDLEFTPKNKLEHIAYELFCTERTYVKKLHLVVEFQSLVIAENKKSRMFPDGVIPQMFSNIKSIYEFHHNFLLPQLKERILSQWDSQQKIGDVLRQLAPYFKMYTEYMVNYAHAMNVITQWQVKSPKFAKIVCSLENKSMCNRLSLFAHLLEPIQRLPRYQLLLKDYIDHLPEDSNDKEDVAESLQLATAAAVHSNECMRKTEKLRKVLEIRESLIGNDAFRLISPTREYIKSGGIVKIAARNGNQLRRYLFLFNDIILVCMPPTTSTKQQYRLKAKLSVDGMKGSQWRVEDARLRCS